LAVEERDDREARNPPALTPPHNKTLLHIITPPNCAHSLTQSQLQCDEQHPICRNCQKSKRDCLGYDPIFKQQSAPQALQPAPGGSTTSASPSPSTATSGATPFSPAQPSYHPPPPQSTTYPPFPKHAPPPSPTQRKPPYETNAAIDPALASSAKAEQNLPEQNNTLAPLAISMESAKTKPGTEERKA
jgi:hypothetical protein